MDISQDSVRRCPKCRSQIDRYAVTCPTCQSDLLDWIDLGSSDAIDIVSYRAVLSEHIRRDVWRRSFKVLLSSGMLLALLGGLFTVWQETRMTKLTETKISLEIEKAKQDAIKQLESELKPLQKDVYNRSIELQTQISLLQDQSNSAKEKIDHTLTEAQDSLKKAQRLAQTVQKTHAESKSKTDEIKSSIMEFGKHLSGLNSDFRKLDIENRLRDIKSEILANAVSYQDLQEVIESPDPEIVVERLTRPRVRLINPISVDRQRPVVLFQNNVQLEWLFPGRELGEEEFCVQIANNPGFNDINLIQNIRHSLDSYDIKLDDQMKGRLYWRVAATSKDCTEQRELNWSEIGIFDLYSNTLDRIKSTGDVRIGISSSYEGYFAFLDSKDQRLKGIDIDLARRIVAELSHKMKVSLQPHFMGSNWNSLFGLLKRNEVDFLIATISIREAREETYGLRFSRPYFKSSQAMIFKKDSDITSVSDAIGRLFAVQKGTTSVDVAKAFSDRIIELSSTAAIVNEINQAKVEIGLMDYPFAVKQVSDHGLNDQLVIISLEEQNYPTNFSGAVTEDYGIAVSDSEQELLTHINTSIKSLETAGFLDKIVERYLNNRTSAHIIY
ncbi:MAG: transporter substrate-binding domain-containing protein [Candidatus Thiodiazotropha sp.]